MCGWVCCSVHSDRRKHSPLLSLGFREVKNEDKEKEVKEYENKT